MRTGLTKLIIHRYSTLTCPLNSETPGWWLPVPVKLHKKVKNKKVGDDLSLQGCVVVILLWEILPESCKLVTAGKVICLGIVQTDQQGLRTVLGCWCAPEQWKLYWQSTVTRSKAVNQGGQTHCEEAMLLWKRKKIWEFYLGISFHIFGVWSPNHWKSHSNNFLSIFQAFKVVF